jgi:hypothetical protein
MQTDRSLPLQLLKDWEEAVLFRAWDHADKEAELLRAWDHADEVIEDLAWQEAAALARRLDEELADYDWGHARAYF